MKNSFPSAIGLILMAIFLSAGVMAGPARAAAPMAITCGDGSKHAVAITFDDGPSRRFTPKILALLKQYQAKATFFVLGCKVEKYPDLIKAEIEDGHELGNHTYSHPRLLKTDQMARVRELERTRLDLDLLGCLGNSENHASAVQ